MKSGNGDTLLNAFIDGELDSEDQRLLLTQCRHDPAVSGRLSELEDAKRWVRVVFALEQHQRHATAVKCEAAD